MAAMSRWVRTRSSKLSENSCCNEINSHLLWHHCPTPSTQRSLKFRSVRLAAERPASVWRPKVFSGGASLRRPSRSFVGTAPYRGAFGSSQSPEDRESNQTPLSRSQPSGGKQSHLFIPARRARHGAPLQAPSRAIRRGSRNTGRQARRPASSIRLDCLHTRPHGAAR